MAVTHLQGGQSAHCCKAAGARLQQARLLQTNFQVEAVLGTQPPPASNFKSELKQLQRT